MSEESSGLKLEDAFLEGPLNVGGFILRPFSLGSLLLAEKMGLSLVLNGGVIIGMTPEEVYRQAAFYAWMQGSFTDDVKQVVRMGVADKIKLPVLNEDSVSVIILEIRRMYELVKMARVKVTGGKSINDTELFHPCYPARFVSLIAGDHGWSEDFIYWNLPYSRIFQYEHCILRKLKWRTVKMDGQSSIVASLAAVEAASAKAATQDRDW